MAILLLQIMEILFHGEIDYFHGATSAKEDPRRHMFLCLCESACKPSFFLSAFFILKAAQMLKSQHLILSLL